MEIKAIRAQKIPPRKISVEDVLATFCYKYPQYTFAQAEKLPYKRIVQMLKISRRLDAEKMLELINIVVAPHTKKGQGVKNIVEYYKGIIKEN